MTEATTAQEQTEVTPTTGRELRRRHLTLIALGGVIGASLFVGSGSVIHAAGPAAILSYAIGGVIVFFVMRMLGEMASARPTAGSFMEHSATALGGWAGFTVGWLYWYFWLGIVAFEAIVAGAILGEWFGAPSWIFALGTLLLFTSINLVSPRTFGEAEFWLASVKVATIIVFLVIGALFVMGLWPNSTAPGLSNLTSAEFMPNGFPPVLQGVVIAIFSYFGTEIITLAAAESKEPAKEIARATVNIVTRILFFYVGTITMLVLLDNWQDVPVTTSPFVAAFEKFGFPEANVIINVVVLTAALSILNTSIFAGSRMLFALAGRGWAPGIVNKRSQRNVPWIAILLCTIGGYIAVALNYNAPQGVFGFVMNSAGLVALLVYLFICLSQLRLRATLIREGKPLHVRMWLHPWGALATIVVIVGVIIAMALDPANQGQVILTAVSLLVTLVAYAVVRVVSKSRKQANVDVR